MIYLLDTDMLIFMIRGLKPGRQPTLRQRAVRLTGRCRKARAAGHVIGLSAVTVSELEFGAHNSGDYNSEIAAVHKVLTPFAIYSYDGVSCPVHYGRIRHDLESAGRAIGSLDTLIAAHALALDATLVTNNLDHFSRVPDLKVVNWLEPGGAKS